MRILLLLATNFAVMLLASVTLNILGVGPMLMRTTSTPLSFSPLTKASSSMGELTRPS